MRAEPGHGAAERTFGREVGLTLVEMLMAMIILGVLFAGTAGALISFSQASVNNERRVQSTATLNRLHEELQALPWDDAVVYEDELDAVPALDGLDLTADPPTFEGEPIVMIEGPDCDVSDPDCRIDTIPEPHHDPLTPAPADGRDYEVFRLVTWVDRDGAPEGSLKRFTTVVRWDVFDRTVEQRFDSERAPTPSETSEGDPSLQFLVTPSESELRTDGTNDAEIELSADFSLLGDVTEAEVTFESLVGVTPTEQVVTLAQQPLSQRFVGIVAPGAFTFAEGSQTFEVIGTTVAGTTYRTDATVTFVPPGSLDNTDPTPTVSPPVQVLDASATRVVGRIGGDDDRLCSAVRLEVNVTDGVNEAIAGEVARKVTTVTASYLSQNGSQSVTLQPKPATSASFFTYEFPAGSDSPWRPTADSPVVDTFKVVAQNPSSGPSSLVESQEIEFTYSDEKNEKC